MYFAYWSPEVQIRHGVGEVAEDEAAPGEQATDEGHAPVRELHRQDARQWT